MQTWRSSRLRSVCSSASRVLPGHCRAPTDTVCANVQTKGSRRLRQPCERRSACMHVVCSQARQGNAPGNLSRGLTGTPRGSAPIDELAPAVDESLSQFGASTSERERLLQRLAAAVRAQQMSPRPFYAKPQQLSPRVHPQEKKTEVQGHAWRPCCVRITQTIGAGALR